MFTKRLHVSKSKRRAILQKKQPFNNNINNNNNNNNSIYLYRKKIVTEQMWSKESKPPSISNFAETARSFLFKTTIKFNTFSIIVKACLRNKKNERIYRAF